MIEYARRIVWIPVINMTAETIPGGALMEPYAISNPVDNGQDEDGNWTVRKPTIDSDPRVIVNGESPIPPGEIGQGHRDTMAVVLYDTTESKPLAGDNYGSKAASWYAHKDYTGFIIDHAGNGRANAQRASSVSTGGSAVTVANYVHPGDVPNNNNGGESWLTGPLVSPGQSIKGFCTITYLFASTSRTFFVNGYACAGLYRLPVGNYVAHAGVNNLVASPPSAANIGSVFSVIETTQAIQTLYLDGSVSFDHTNDTADDLYIMFRTNLIQTNNYVRPRRASVIYQIY